ncbi:hypothetical protein [Tardiphaga sp. 813_E8_N1_3]|uniref:hypothetical protein n=1 Tax=Tardiphaga sp. 813_E8_N1_3 TaxID=3240760 RepID=UPI003F24B986
MFQVGKYLQDLVDALPDQGAVAGFLIAHEIFSCAYELLFAIEAASETLVRIPLTSPLKPTNLSDQVL